MTRNDMIAYLQLAAETLDQDLWEKRLNGQLTKTSIIERLMEIAACETAAVELREMTYDDRSFFTNIRRTWKILRGLDR